jgi:hypothetical protein
VREITLSEDHPILMSVPDRRADGAEQPQTIPGGQFLGVAVQIDRPAIDIVHDEVGRALLGRATIQELGDVGVVQVGQDLPLGAKAAENGLRIHAALDQLDRHLLLVLIIGAHRQIDGSHAAAADLACHLVRADVPSHQRHRLIFVEPIASNLRCGPLQEAGLLLVVDQ